MIPEPALTVAPVTLEGAVVRLVPLEPSHAERLVELASGDAFRFMSTPLRTRADGDAYVADALAAQRAGAALPFATVERASGLVIGATRFGNVEPRHRRAEIGWTFLGIPWQRTGANTEAKLLMLRHAFEVWRLNRVEFKADALNERSRAALRRIGATEEGIFRRHMVMPDGRVRDTAWSSVVAEEWPAVKARLEALLRARGAAAAPGP